MLIVTNRPAIANSWYSDYVRFLGRESGYLFVSHVDALAGQPHVLDEQGYLDAAAQGEELYKRIEFVSLQDMKGSKYFGGEYDKLRHLTELNWDMMLCVISYWVLSGAKWRQIQQLRCCCALSRQAVEMKEAPAKPYTKIRKK